MEDDKQTIMIVTDAWYPQVNGVVRTLSQTREELTSLGYNVVMLTPEGFPTIPCPTYPEIRLSLMPASKVARIIRQVSPDYLHIATEGPLGLAARNFAKRNGNRDTIRPIQPDTDRYLRCQILETSSDLSRTGIFRFR